MKKVGIATMVGGSNYGNSLQNYAVQEIVASLGYEAYTLDNRTKRGFLVPAKKPISVTKKLCPAYIVAYRRTRLYSKYGCKNSRDCSLRGLTEAKRNVSQYREVCQRRREKFAVFNQTHIRFDSHGIDNQTFPREHLQSFYAFVSGSDQVWNPYFHSNSMIDFLQFAPEHKRIAFVPSFGISKIPDSRIYDYTQWLNAFAHLSVREDAGAAIIKELTGKDVPVLLDPTFGLTREQWLSFAKKPLDAPKGEYVFCYFLGNEVETYRRWIENYAVANNCQIVRMLDIRDLGHYDTDPCEFVWLLANAKIVFTDSFHGTAFSVNMQVPFVAFERQEGGASMSSRITTLLNKTGLSERVFSYMKDKPIQQIDFTTASEIVVGERERMFAYLSNALATVEDGKEPLLANRYHCTGCGACANACSVGALRMSRDVEGFAYPLIDKELCIHCGACERACPTDTPRRATDILPKAYYAFARSKEAVQASSSGGVFGVLAERILADGGAVFGVGFDERFHVCHMQINSAQELYKLRTSKYVQSDTGMIYQSVKSTLDNGRPVLFVGTSCQVAALYCYLGKSYENLYTADIICHGVPSPLVWEEYLRQCHGEKIIRSISFRDKTKGWYAFSMRMEYEDGVSYCKLAKKDPYISGFLASLFLRPSCYQCQYKTVNRASDITLADYWGVELVHPDLKEQQGVSLVLLHSEKGKLLLERVEDGLHFGITDATRAIAMNHAAQHSVPMHKKRQIFFERFQTESFERLVKHCLKMPLKKRIYRAVKISGSRVKRIIRGIRRK